MIKTTKIGKEEVMTAAPTVECRGVSEIRKSGIWLSA